MGLTRPACTGPGPADPLIVHVPDVDAGVKLAVFGSPEEEAAFRALAKAFWPGPLTMVVKACDAIPLKGAYHCPPTSLTASRRGGPDSCAYTVLQ